MTHDVFISYSNKDKAIADAIANKFESNNLKCWYAPRDIQPGKEWAESIVEAIKQSKIMVLVFTDYSNSSKQVVREVETAINNGTIIIPFKLTSNNPSGSMEYYLSTLHWLDAVDKKEEESINDLLEMAQSILNNKDITIKNKKKNLLKPALVITLALVIVVCATKIIFKENKNTTSEENLIDEAPAFDLSLCDLNTQLNKQSIEGSFSTTNYDKSKFYYIDYSDDLFCIRESNADGFLDKNDGKIIVDSYIPIYNLVYLNDHLIYCDYYDYPYIVDLNTYEVSSFSDDKFKNLSCSGDWLIYYDVYSKSLKRCTVDNKYIFTFDGINLNEDNPVYYVYNNKIYYLDNSGLLFIYDNGTIAKALFDDDGGETFNSLQIKIDNFIIINDCIFTNLNGNIWFANMFDENGNYNLNKNSERGYFVEGHTASQIIPKNHKLYFIDSNDDLLYCSYFDSNDVFRVDIIENSVTKINYLGDYLYLDCYDLNNEIYDEYKIISDFN